MRICLTGTLGNGMGQLSSVLIGALAAFMWLPDITLAQESTSSPEVAPASGAHTKELMWISSTGEGGAVYEYQGGVLEIQPTKLPTTDAVKELATLPPTRGPAKDYIAQIKERCGWLDPAVLAEFQRLNSLDSLDIDPESRGIETFLYPTCVRVSPSSALVAVFDGVKEKSLLSSRTIKKLQAQGGLSEALSWAKDADKHAPESGSLQAAENARKLPQESSRTLSEENARTLSEEKARKLSEEIRSGRLEGAAADKLRAEAFDSTTLALANQIEGDRKAAINTVRDAEQKSVTVIPMKTVFESGNAGGILTTLETTNELNPLVPALISPLTSAAADTDCEKGAVPSNRRARNWPFTTTKLVDALLLNAYERSIRGRSSTPVPVLVADTGFPIEVFATSESLQKSPSELETSQFFRRGDFFVIDDERGQNPDDPRDQNEDKVARNEYGVSLQKMTGEINPAASYEFRHHGMSVASLAIGGIQLSRFRMLGTLPIRLHFANLMDEAASPVKMSDRDLATLVEYAEHNDIGIANLSFESSKPITSLGNRINAARGMLFVVAAGNGSSQLAKDGFERHPALLGGKADESGGVVITVGAHREDGTPADFSNYSQDYVDIFAPGCFIPVPVFDKVTNKLTIEPQHGTSFAAPIVTFVAALLRSEGLRPQEVKRRLIFSAVHDPALAEKARHGARLDPEAALAVYHDLIDIKSAEGAGEQRLRGRLNRNDAIELPDGCKGPRRIREFLRIERLPAQGASFRVFRLVQRDTGSSYEPEECVIPEDKMPILSFFDIDALETRNISLRDINRVIFRSR